MFDLFKAKSIVRNICKKYFLSKKRQYFNLKSLYFAEDITTISIVVFQAQKAIAVTTIYNPSSLEYIAELGIINISGKDLSIESLGRLQDGPSLSLDIKIKINGSAHKRIILEDVSDISFSNDLKHYKANCFVKSAEIL